MKLPTWPPSRFAWLCWGIAAFIYASITLAFLDVWHDPDIMANLWNGLIGATSLTALGFLEWRWPSSTGGRPPRQKS